MPDRLFNRQLDLSDESYSHILPLLQLTRDVGTVSSERMLENIALDWRVSPERERDFLDPAFTDSPPSTLQEWVSTYFAKRVREATVPDFLYEHNKPNRRSEMVPETEFVQVFRVSSLLPEVIATVAEGMMALPGALHNFLDGESYKESAAWAKKLLSACFPRAIADVTGLIEGSAEEVQLTIAKMQGEFLDGLWEVLHRESPDFHPNWVALWDEFSTFIGESADVWLALLGKPSPRYECLCLVLKYRAEDVWPPLLPTILDVGWYAPHFPNPPAECSWKVPGSSRPSGGHPVSFDEDERPLLQEYIHRNVRKKGDWVVTWGWTTSNYREKELEAARIDHVALLSENYDAVGSWIDPSK